MKHLRDSICLILLTIISSSSVVLVYFSSRAIFTTENKPSADKTIINTALFLLTSIPLSVCLGAVSSLLYYVRKRKRQGKEGKGGVRKGEGDGGMADMNEGSAQEPSVPGIRYEDTVAGEPPVFVTRLDQAVQDVRTLERGLRVWR